MNTSDKKDTKPRGVTPLSELPLANNFMFGMVMRIEEVCQAFLEALFQKEIARIEFITKEADLSDTYMGHGIRLDIYLQDENNTRYNIEMQLARQDAIERRIRYYQGGIDRDFLDKGADYDELPESYVIFICNFDYFGAGLACYERVSHIKGLDNMPYEDGSHAILLNTRYTEKNVCDEIVEFLDYLRTNDDSRESSGELTILAKKWVNEFRHDTAKEGAYMTFARLIQDTEKAAKAEGRAEGQAEMLKEMLKSMSILDASRYTGISVDDIKKLIEK